MYQWCYTSESFAFGDIRVGQWHDAQIDAYGVGAICGSAKIAPLPVEKGIQFSHECNICIRLTAATVTFCVPPLIGYACCLAQAVKKSGEEGLAEKNSIRIIGEQAPQLRRKFGTVAMIGGEEFVNRLVVHGSWCSEGKA